MKGHSETHDKPAGTPPLSPPTPRPSSEATSESRSAEMRGAYTQPRPIPEHPHPMPEDPQPTPGNGHTSSGRPKAKRAENPFTTRLPDEFFDEIEARSGLGRRLTPVRRIAVANPDPIIERALAVVRREFGANSDALEDTLSQRYLTEVEAVTSRLNARQLPRLTRLLLTQNGVYVNLVADAIAARSGHIDAAPSHAAPSTDKPADIRRSTE